MDRSGVGLQIATWTAVGTAAALVSTSLSLLYKRYYLFVHSDTGRPAPGPVPVPLLGNVLALTSDFYRTMATHAGCLDDPVLHQSSSMPPVFWVGNKPFVVINSVDGVRRVLGGAKAGLYIKPRYFGYRSRAIREAVASQKAATAVASAQYDPEADSSRAALRVLIEGAFPLIQATTRNILTRLGGQEGQDQALAVVSHEIVHLNLQTLFKFCDFRAAEQTAAQIVFAGEEFARRMLNPFRCLFHWALTIKFYRNVYALIKLGRKLCQQLDQGLSDGQGTWVHAWIGKVGSIGKLGKVVGLLMASTQTVPLTALWVLYLVANDQKVLERARSELEEATGGFGSEGLTYQVMLNLPFCEAIIKEALRLYPPFPLLQRQAQEDDIIDNLRIPRGTIVYISPWIVHNHRGIWKNPQRFNPDRFMDNPNHGDSDSDFAYIPFGRGSRMCAGYRLATLELTYLLAHAILDYDMDIHFPTNSNIVRISLVAYTGCLSLSRKLNLTASLIGSIPRSHNETTRNHHCSQKERRIDSVLNPAQNFLCTPKSSLGITSADETD